MSIFQGLMLQLAWSVAAAPLLLGVFYLATYWPLVFVPLVMFFTMRFFLGKVSSYTAY